MAEDRSVELSAELRDLMGIPPQWANSLPGAKGPESKSEGEQKWDRQHSTSE